MNKINKRELKFWIITILTSIITILACVYLYLNRDKDIIYTLIISYMFGFGAAVHAGKLMIWLYEKFGVTE